MKIKINSSSRTFVWLPICDTAQKQTFVKDNTNNGHING